MCSTSFIVTRRFLKQVDDLAAKQRTSVSVSSCSRSALALMEKKKGLKQEKRKVLQLQEGT